jgi:hypothetical protein
MTLFWGVSKIIWEDLVLLILIAAFGMQIGSIYYSEWFTQDLTIFGTYLGEIQGSLRHPVDYSHSYKYYSDHCNSTSLAGSGYCDELKNWDSAGTAYFYLSIVSCCLVVVVALLVVLDMVKFRKYRMIVNLTTSNVVLLVVTGLHCVAFAVWAGMTKLTFGKCRHSLPMDEAHSVCGQGGATFSIGILVFLVGFTVFYSVLVRAIKHAERNVDESGQRRLQNY